MDEKILNRSFLFYNLLLVFNSLNFAFPRRREIAGFESKMGVKRGRVVMF